MTSLCTFCEKDYLHVLQEYGFSPIWIKLLIVEKLFVQESQEFCFSPVWILLWAFNPPFSQKVFSHVSQENGYSPVWIVICTFKFPFLENSLQQILHLIMMDQKLFLHLKYKKKYFYFENVWICSFKLDFHILIKYLNGENVLMYVL